MLQTNAETVIVLDFETTGLSPDQGDRPIEVGAVLMERGRVKDRFQEVMNPGFRISSFIESYTGISQAMVKKAPPCEEVMSRFADFISGHNLVAHNAAFDQRFLDAELSRIGRSYPGGFGCSLLVARRLYLMAPSYNLGNLIRYTDLAAEDVFHRALADAEMAARLWLRMINQLQTDFQLPEVPFELVKKISKLPKHKVKDYLTRYKSRADT
jgi:DNA polymerase-3 subunit epsilon